MGGGWLPGTIPQAMGAASVFLANLSEPVPHFAQRTAHLFPDIFGGFLITKRMLDLFKRPTDPPEYSWLFAIPAALFFGGFLYASQTGLGGLVQAGYFLSTLLSIGALTGLSSQSTARMGNALGMLGVAFGILASLLAVGFDAETIGQAVVLTAMGGALGLAIGARVTPMQLPQTVAALHSVVGLAAVLTSAAAVLGHGAGEVGTLHLVMSYLGVLIGGVTFTGERDQFHLPLRLLSGWLWRGTGVCCFGLLAEREERGRAGGGGGRAGC